MYMINYNFMKKTLFSNEMCNSPTNSNTAYHTQYNVCNIYMIHVHAIVYCTKVALCTYRV